jgi:hypothetical protein
MESITANYVEPVLNILPNRHQIKIYRLSSDYILNMFDGRENHWKIIEGMMPQNSKIIDVKKCGLYEGDAIDFLVWNATFPFVGEGDSYEIITMVAKTIK